MFEGRDLTRHVYHPTLAYPQDLIGLTEQATGADAVRVISWELLFAGGAAVTPGLGQIGQLSTKRFIRRPSEAHRQTDVEDSKVEVVVGG